MEDFQVYDLTLYNCFTHPYCMARQSFINMNAPNKIVIRNKQIPDLKTRPSAMKDFDFMGFNPQILPTEALREEFAHLKRQIVNYRAALHREGSKMPASGYVSTTGVDSSDSLRQ